MKENKKFGNRDQRQNDEGYHVVSTGLPSDRFQESKQVLTPDQLGGADSSVAGTAGPDTVASAAAKRIKAKLSIRPDASVETLEGKQVGGVPLENTAVARSAAGFGGQSVADDTSKIPYQAGNYRPTTRYGKKRSEDLFELDNTVSEQIVPEVDDAKDLREAPNAVMGYNGRKQFKQTRAKKNYRGLPQSLLFDASADIELHNYTLATCGQVIDLRATADGVEDNVDIQANYPTQSALPDDKGKIQIQANIPGDSLMKKSNYRLTGLQVTVEDGKIAGLQFNETQLPVCATKIVRDQANLNWQTDANNVTKSMIRMQTELGRETTEKWSPLGYVVNQPYQYNMLMHDIEATTGAIMATAYRSAVSSLAYQRNIISKDGIGPVTSAVRMFLEGAIGSLKDSTIIPENSGFGNSVWSKSLFQRGSAAALIEMFDSTGKYRTKADVLGMQRSLALHLSQADNNINPLRMKPEYMRVLDKAHMFSTIDGTYNPLLPIHVTKKIDIINPLSLNAFLKGWKHPSTLASYTGADKSQYDLETGLKSTYNYQYTDLRNSYFTQVQHPVVAGLVMWLLRHEHAFCSKMGDGTFTIPASFDFTAPSLFQFMMCSASQYVALQRNVIFRDILFAGEQSSYIWDDLTSIKDLDPLHSTQLTIGEYNTELRLGKLSADSALRIFWSDNISMLTHTGNTINSPGKAVYAMPWYMNEQAFSKTASGDDPICGFYDEDTAFNMSIPSIRQGVRHQYIDLIKGMEENDVRLAMDRMLDVVPFAVSTASPLVERKYQLRGNPSQRAANMKIVALRYDNNSDGRVLVEYDCTGANFTGTDAPVIAAGVYMIPKELGWIWNRIPAPSEIITSFTPASGNDSAAVSVLANGRSEDQTLTSSVGDELRSYRVKGDADTKGAISRSAALSQVYYSAFSTPLAHAINANYTSQVGIVINASYEDAGYETVTNCLYQPKTSITEDSTGVQGITSFARTMWSMIQRFFRPVNPFENCYEPKMENLDNPTDPLEACFYFGLCGFLASDYTQAVLERLDTYDQLGLDYLEDVNIRDSLIFR